MECSSLTARYRATRSKNIAGSRVGPKASAAVNIVRFGEAERGFCDGRVTPPATHWDCRVERVSSLSQWQPLTTTRANGTHMRPAGQRTQTDIIRARLPTRPTMTPEAQQAVEAAMIKRSTWNVVHLQLVDGEYRLAA